MTLVLAFALSAGYRRDRPGVRRFRTTAEGLALAVFIALVAAFVGEVIAT